MATEEIREAMEGAIEYLRENPEEASYTDSLATASMVGDTLECVIIDPEGREVRTDMPSSVGGGASTFSPGWLLRAGLASCTATLIAMRAAQMGVSLEDLEVRVDSQSNDLGILGIDEEVPAGPLSVRVEVHARVDAAAREAARSVAQWGIDHCPVTDAVRRDVHLEAKVELE